MRPLSKEQLEAAKAEFQKMFDQGLLVPSTSPWGALIVMVRKPSGKRAGAFALTTGQAMAPLLNNITLSGESSGHARSHQRSEVLCSLGLFKGFLASGLFKSHATQDGGKLPMGQIRDDWNIFPAGR